MNWRDRISVDPFVCHGAACISQERASWFPWSSTIFADGLTAGEIVASYPSLTAADVNAAIAYAR